MRTQWVYQFRNCPGGEDVEALAADGRPQHVLARRRPGGALADGYVLQSIDAQLRTAVYTWVRAGEPDAVAAHLLELLAEVCPGERAR